MSSATESIHHDEATPDPNNHKRIVSGIPRRQPEPNRNLLQDLNSIQAEIKIKIKNDVVGDTTTNNNNNNNNSKGDGMDEAQQKRIWDDREALQDRWSLIDKGWQVPMVWKQSGDLGIGAFVSEDVPQGSILRVGIVGKNLLKFESISDLEMFLESGGPDQYEGRLQYLQDYLSGMGTDTLMISMWMPGSSVNHSATVANTIMEITDTAESRVELIATSFIPANTEVLFDYNRFQTAPSWIKEFAAAKKVNMCFPGLNDFVQ